MSDVLPITTILYTKNNNLFRDMKEIPYANVKGEALSLAAYNTTGKRTYNDIDILVAKSKLKNIEAVLIQNGYEPATIDKFKKYFHKSNSHQTVPYVKKIGFVSVHIDVNFSIFWGEYNGKPIDMEIFLADTIVLDIYGIKVKSLPPVKALIQLILHHYKDMNSIFLLATRKSIKYEMFRDVYALLMNNLDSITLDKLYAISLEYEIVPYVYYIFYHTCLLFEDNIMKEYTAAFKTPEGIALLKCYGLTESERKEWRCDFQTRLDAEDLIYLIKDQLTSEDKKKININKEVFLNV